MRKIDLITKEELLERYIREMVRYLSFDGAQLCQKDFLSILESHLGKDYTKEDLFEYLENFGSPYAFSCKYEKSNFFLSIRNYQILVKFLRVLNVEIFFACIVFFSVSREKIFLAGTLEALKSVLVMVFFSTLVSSYVAEKIKGIKLLNSIVSDFKLDDLFCKNYIKINFKILLASFITCFILIYIVFRNRFYGLEYSYFQIIFSLKIFRDISILSENGFSKYIRTISLFTDMVNMLILASMFNKSSIDYLVVVLFFIFTLNFLRVILRLVNINKRVFKED